MPARRSANLTWETVQPAPVVLVRGPEAVLAERAERAVIDQVRASDPDVEITRIDAAAYEKGRLLLLTSASLFGEPRLVHVEHLEAMTDALLEEALAYLEDPAPDVVLLMRHHTGTRGKKLLDAVAAAGHPVVRCEALKRDSDKADLVRADVRRARGRIEPGAVKDLVDALGSDVAELVSSVAQLLADSGGDITAEQVRRFHAGRVEATGFEVADAAVAGRLGPAIALLRHAVATGTGPVPVVAALASKLRTMAIVSASRGGGAPKGLAPWQADRARRDLAGWTPHGLAAAISAVAAADAEVKGLSRDPVFATERAVRRIAEARSR
ncbi:DNA polymerase III subunit delta [Georgenia sp. Z1491]|uniref:DNA polymerase III subunit delta n=1 Tax=Georgenia sp. Z1491 TaxID=3416707 RepID=UPI003CE724FF